MLHLISNKNGIIYIRTALFVMLHISSVEIVIKKQIMAHSQKQQNTRIRRITPWVKDAITRLTSEIERHVVNPVE